MPDDTERPDPPLLGYKPGPVFRPDAVMFPGFVIPLLIASSVVVGLVLMFLFSS